MRFPNNPADKTLFEEIFSDPRRAGDAITWKVTVKGRTVRAIDPHTMTEADGAAVILESTLPSPLDRETEGADVQVLLHVEDVPWKEYQGFLVDWSREDDDGGFMGAATAGHWQAPDGDDSIKWNVQKSFNDRPDRVFLECLRRFPYRRIKIPSIPSPIYTNLADEPFPMTAAIGETIGDVEEKTLMRQRDSWLNDAGVFHIPSIDRIVTTSPNRTLREGIEISTVTYERRSQSRFYDVGVARQAPDGTYISLVEPRPRVRYPSEVTPPPVGATFWTELVDDTATATRDARSLAFKLASTLYPGEFDMEIIMDYIDVRIEDFDSFRVKAVDRETEETITFWFTVEAQNREYAVPRHTLTGTGAIVGRREKKTRVRPEFGASDPVYQVVAPYVPVLPSDFLLPNDFFVPSGSTFQETGAGASGPPEGEPLAPSSDLTPSADLVPSG